MPILFSNIGDEVKVAAVGGSPSVKQHLVELGFNVGTHITIVQKIATGLIVRVKDARIALDKDMASKIRITPV